MTTTASDAATDPRRLEAWAGEARLNLVRLATADGIGGDKGEELGIGHKGVTPDGIFSLEEVECIGACSWAPAIQVNYAFHDELNPAHVADLLAEYRVKAGAPGDGSLSLGKQTGAPGKPAIGLVEKEEVAK